jgi:hypothetical protein
MKTEIHLVVDHVKPIANLAKLVEQRVYTIDGVSDANAVELAAELRRLEDECERLKRDAQRGRDAGFFDGIIAALGVVRILDQPTIWKDIVKTAGVEQVLKHALSEEGDWSWAGFEEYAYTELGEAAVLAAIEASKEVK